MLLKLYCTCHHDEEVLFWAFSPDDHLRATCSKVKTVKVSGYLSGYPCDQLKATHRKERYTSSSFSFTLSLSFNHQVIVFLTAGVEHGAGLAVFEVSLPTTTPPAGHLPQQQSIMHEGSV